MREVVLAVAALVVGLVLGGVFPRAEVRQLKTEVAELSEKECRPRLGEELTGFFVRPPAPAASEPEWEEVITPEPEGEPPLADEPPPVREDSRPTAEDRDEGLAAAREALRLRRTQARASLLEDARPDEAQLEDFDAAVDDMNADLRVLGEDMVARIQEYGEPTRHEMMVFAADTLDVLLTAEDRMASAVGPDQAQDVDEAALDPFSYIDPSLVDLFAELDR